MELSPHVSSVRERVHFESSLEQKSFIRVRGATNPATRRNPVDYHASRVLNGTGEMESGTQAPQLRIGRWKQACCCSSARCIHMQWAIPLEFQLCHDDPVLYSKLDEIGICFKAKILHDAVFVKGHSPWSDLQNACHLFHRFPFCQQLDDFSLTRRQ